MVFYILLPRNTQVLANQQGITYIRSVQTLGAVWKTCKERWVVGTNRETGRLRESTSERAREGEGERQSENFEQSLGQEDDYVYSYEGESRYIVVGRKNHILGSFNK